ncbi:MAG: MlaD family protein [Candidatus Sumerlaeia bacterium]|nr:MlaD family protein [Candidatus Sumerlaeia bacterium]
MSQRPNHFKLGLFVLGGACLLLAAVLLLGAKSAFTEGRILETYLDESVQGLDVGSPVKYRGVRIGSVRTISFVRTAYEEATPEQARYVLIRAELDPSVSDEADGSGFVSFLESEIARGMRVRPTSQGITGLVYLEVDYFGPDPEPGLPISWEPDYFYVPSMPSRITEIASSLESMAKNLGDTDFAALAGNVNRLLNTVETQLVGADVAGLTGEFRLLAADLRRTNAEVLAYLNREEIQRLPADARDILDRVNETLTGTGDDIRALIESSRRTAERAESLTARLDALVNDPRLDSALSDASASASNLREASAALPAAAASGEAVLARMDQLLARREDDLRAVAENLRALTANLRYLSEVAKQYPSSLILGDPPKPPEE